MDSTALTTSVVVVSRGRAGALTLCLTGLVQQDHPAFEIVVVADVPGLKALRAWEADTNRTGQIKSVAFDEPNISVARNLGIAEAAGDIIAFIDDDAVPETTWLRRLTDPFRTGDSIHTAGGFVRGRNGISYQWQAQSVDRTGFAAPLHIDGDTPVALSPTAERAIKVEGTNMAFRRSILAELGGFDPAYHYYLDETDLTVRLAVHGGETAIVPLAEVHHGYHANPTRSSGRVPRDLFQIGASLAVFLRRHCPPHLRDAARDRLRDEQRTRLLRHMVSGALDPFAVGRILRSFDAGYAEGLQRTLTALAPLPHASRPFQAVPKIDAPNPVVLTGRSWQRAALERAARKSAQGGGPVSVFCFSPTTLYHKVQYRAPGYWLQTGGIFGRSTRAGSIFKVTSFRARVASERQRVAKQRGF